MVHLVLAVSMMRDGDSFFLQAKGINIIRTDACALQVLTSFPVFLQSTVFFNSWLAYMSLENKNELIQLFGLGI